MIEPNENQYSLLEDVAGRLESHIPVDSALKNLLAWSRGEAGPFALLISLDSKYAILRELDMQGEASLYSGEEVLTFFHVPIEGGTDKFLEVLDREIGIYASQCEKFGYSTKLNRSNLRRRTHLQQFGEFDPYEMAIVGFFPENSPTGALVWASLLDESEVREFGGFPKFIRAELKKRLRVSVTGKNYDTYDRNGFFDSHRLTMTEIASRKERAHRYWSALERVASQVEGTESEHELELKVSDAIKSFDLAVEVYVLARFDEENRGLVRRGTLTNLLWKRMRVLDQEDIQYPEVIVVN